MIQGAIGWKEAPVTEGEEGRAADSLGKIPREERTASLRIKTFVHRGLKTRRYRQIFQSPDPNMIRP